MARRPIQPTSQSPVLTPNQVRRCIEKFQRCIRDLDAFDPQKVQKRDSIPEVMALEAAIEDALSAAFGHGTPAYNRYKRAASLDNGPHFLRSEFGRGRQIDYDAQDAMEARKYLAEGKQQSIALLQQAIRKLEDEISDQEHEGQAPVSMPAGEPAHGRKVFVVHGHDEAALQAVARFLERIGLEAIVLREEPDQGRTIIEKFEDCAGEVGFAVVLLTPDDIAAVAVAQASAARARQNVIFELGYFVSKLGRGRACLLRKGEVAIPSDLYGVIYTEMDDAEGWKLRLIRNLRPQNWTSTQIGCGDERACPCDRIHALLSPPPVNAQTRFRNSSLSNIRDPHPHRAYARSWGKSNLSLGLSVFQPARSTLYPKPALKAASPRC